MASIEHEAPLAILKESPALLNRLLRRLGKIKHEGTGDTRLGSIDLTQIKPAHAHADLITIDWADTKPSLVQIFEVQLDYDLDKKFSWPLYTAAAHQQYRCDVILVVYAPDLMVAAWATKPIQSFQLGQFAPLVLTIDDIPSLETQEAAAKDPLLAAFSASVHGTGSWRGTEVSKAAWIAVEALPPHQTQTLKDLIFLRATPKQKPTLKRFPRRASPHPKKPSLLSCRLLAPLLPSRYLLAAP